MPSPAAPADRPPHGRRILLVSYYPPTRRHAGGLRLLDLCSLIRKLEPALRVDLVTCTDSMADPLTEGDRRVLYQVFLLPVRHFTARGLAAAGVLDTAYDVADFQYWQSGRLIAGFRRRQRARIIFSPMESNAKAFLNDIRGARTGFALRPLLEHSAIGMLELLYACKADAVQVVSRPAAATSARSLP